ncbi:hypothetical protein KAH43_04810 [Candidatus Bipolaricaulota bacterium]|nr:hypothetical protein [Candidatus Bipolaricaulota bacterium]
MLNESLEALEKSFRDLADAFCGNIEWRWDNRFQTALGEFSADMKDDVLGILEKYLISTWDSSSIEEAPAIVQEIKRKLGGLSSGQLLLLSDLNRGAFVFCAWWPWGSGKKISIRIGPFSNDLSADETVALTTVFRSSFKI